MKQLLAAAALLDAREQADQIQGHSREAFLNLTKGAQINQPPGSLVKISAWLTDLATANQGKVLRLEAFRHMSEGHYKLARPDNGHAAHFDTVRVLIIR